MKCRVGGFGIHCKAPSVGFAGLLSGLKGMEFRADIGYISPQSRTTLG